MLSDPVRLLAYDRFLHTPTHGCHGAMDDRADTSIISAHTFGCKTSKRSGRRGLLPYQHGHNTLKGGLGSGESYMILKKDDEGKIMQSVTNGLKKIVF